MTELMISSLNPFHSCFKVGQHERHCGPLLTFRTVWRSAKSKIPHIRGDDNVTFADYDTASSPARGDGANKVGQRRFSRSVQPPVRTRPHLALAHSH
jgi:hypothetical protein